MTPEELDTKLQTFIAEHTDVLATFENCPDGSCMCIMHLYMQEVLGITDPAALAQPIAAEVYTNFPNLAGHENFIQIENTPDGIPSKGDIMVFGANAEVGIPEGHVCIFLDGDVNQFNSFDSNFPTGSLPHIQNHTYNDVLGWLHPISVVAEVVPPTPEAATPDAAVDANTYKGLDLTNTDSVKAAIDAWSDVANGQFIRADEHLATLKSIADTAGSNPDVDSINAKITELKNKPAEIVEKTVEVPAVVEAHPLEATYPALTKVVHASFLQELLSLFGK